MYPTKTRFLILNHLISFSRVNHRHRSHRIFRSTQSTSKSRKSPLCNATRVRRNSRKRNAAKATTKVISNWKFSRFGIRVTSTARSPNTNRSKRISRQRVAFRMCQVNGRQYLRWILNVRSSWMDPLARNLSQSINTKQRPGPSNRTKRKRVTIIRCTNRNQFQRNRIYRNRSQRRRDRRNITQPSPVPRITIKTLSQPSCAIAWKCRSIPRAPIASWICHRQSESLNSTGNSDNSWSSLPTTTNHCSSNRFHIKQAVRTHIDQNCHHRRRPRNSSQPNSARVTTTAKLKRPAFVHYGHRIHQRAMLHTIDPSKRQHQIDRWACHGIMNTTNVFLLRWNSTVRTRKCPAKSIAHLLRAHSIIAAEAVAAATLHTINSKHKRWTDMSPKRNRMRGRRPRTTLISRRLRRHSIAINQAIGHMLRTNTIISTENLRNRPSNQSNQFWSELKVSRTHRRRIETNRECPNMVCSSLILFVYSVFSLKRFEEPQNIESVPWMSFFRTKKWVQLIFQESKLRESAHHWINSNAWFSWFPLDGQLSKRLHDVNESLLSIVLHIFHSWPRASKLIPKTFLTTTQLILCIKVPNTSTPIPVSSISNTILATNLA